MILISPWARVTTDQKPSPKNYPHWPKVVELLRSHGCLIHQISIAGDPGIGADQRFDELPLKEIEGRILECQTWVSVDNFFQHLAWTLGKRGVAIFGQSDPLIFGHPENVNLLKDRKYLRREQWWLWSQTPYQEDVWIHPSQVFAAVRGILRQQ